MITKRIRSLFNPHLYHGWGRSRRFFEGWYFKVVSRSGDRAMAFIPGISMTPEGERHSFIQVLDGKNLSSEYFRFSDLDFVANPRQFELQLEGNYFSNEKLVLNLPGITGALNFSKQVPWPVTWHSPGIMGPYAFVPFMECYHGILSLDHNIEGQLNLNGVDVDFTGGKGYTEKDWGRSFPSAYIWIQTNHFSKPSSSLKISIAKIPWLGSSFVGFIAGLLVDGRLYRFTTYNRTRLDRVFVDKDKVEIRIENSSYSLELLILRTSATKLSSPINGFMGGHIYESMEAEIEVSLFDKKKNRKLFQDKGINGGLEIAGEINEILV
jgi:hypothetical protein